jgi:hypothetical protein
MISTAFIPVTREYVIKGITMSKTLSTKDIYYISGKTKEEATDKDVKNVAKSSKLVKALGAVKVDGSFSKEVGKTLDGISFYLKSVVTPDYLNKYLDICRKIKELEEEKNIYYSKIQSEAALYLECNGDNRPTLSTEEGYVTATNAITISTDRPAKIKKILDDKAGDYVKRSTVYEMNSKLKKILGIMISGNYAETTIEEFAAKVYSAATKNTTVNITEFLNGIKKTFDANVKYFIKSYGIEESCATELAREYTKMLNYNELKALMVSSGVDTMDKEQIEKFKADLCNALIVKQTMRIETVTN